MKYAVAVIYFRVYENTVNIVEAESPLDAVVKAVKKDLKDYPDVNKDIEHLLNKLFDEGMGVSRPVALDNI